MSEPVKQRSVWVSVLMTVVAMMIAKACVNSATTPRRPHSGYTGGR